MQYAMCICVFVEQRNFAILQHTMYIYWKIELHKPDRIVGPWGQRTFRRFSAVRSSQWSCGKVRTPGQAWSAASKACAPEEDMIEMRNRKEIWKKSLTMRKGMMKTHRFLKVERRLDCEVNRSPQCNQIRLCCVNNRAWASMLTMSCWHQWSLNDVINSI